jgi:hypothetical protein
VDILPLLETVRCHPDFQLSVSKASSYYTELSGRNNDTVQPNNADLVSLSKQRFEQLGMKTPDVKAFFDKVQKLYTVKDMGNPFMEETGDLFTLDTKIIAHIITTCVCPQYIGEELGKHEWIYFPFLRQFAVILIFNCQ